MRQQYYGIDLLRILACVLMILTHSCECYYISNYFAFGSFENFNLAAWQSEALWAVIIDSFSHTCVPIFVLISGFLLLPMKPGMTMGEFYRKRAVRILIPLIVWTIIYSIYNTLTTASGLNTWTDYAMKTLSDLGYMFINFPAPYGHLWYVYMVLGLYLIIPILSPWVERASRKEMRLMLGVWMVASLVPFAHLIWPEMWGECDWNPFGAHWYVSGFVGYLLAGAYARKYLFEDGKSYLGIGIALIVVGYLLMLSGMLYNIYLNPPTAETYATYINLPFEITWFFCGLPNFLQTCGIFLLLFKVSKPLPAVASDFSRLSYGVYLGHIIFLTWFYDHVFVSLTWPTPIKILGICLCAVVTTYAVIKALSYLPKSKWIVG